MEVKIMNAFDNFEMFDLCINSKVKKYKRKGLGHQYNVYYLKDFLKIIDFFYALLKNNYLGIMIQQ